MQTVDLASLKSIDAEYEKASDIVFENYRGDWDDKIHDSYLLYLNQTQENSRRIHLIRCKTEIIEKKVEELKIEELKRIAEDLCREADFV